VNEIESAPINRGVIRKQVLGFSVAGAAALVLDIFVFNLFNWASGDPSLSNLIAGAMALLANFAINLHTFRGSSRAQTSLQAARKFSLVAGVSVVLVYALFEAFLRIAPESNELVLTAVRVLIIGGSSAARFLLYRQWVF